MGEFRREVLPARPAPSLGLTAPLVVLMGTLFVTVAMAAMAMIPRATPRCHGRVTPIQAPPAVRAARVAAAPVAAPDVDRVQCRAPIHRANPDGTVAVTFSLCAGPSFVAPR
ncbi:MAG: hypothetical protein IPL61_11275 [Myxococcales bacterium]|nr:hypothetical protein [Myxococcales bacterium]